MGQWMGQWMGQRMGQRIGQRIGMCSFRGSQNLIGSASGPNFSLQPLSMRQCHLRRSAPGRGARRAWGADAPAYSSVSVLIRQRSRHNKGPTSPFNSAERSRPRRPSPWRPVKHRRDRDSRKAERQRCDIATSPCSALEDNLSDVRSEHTSLPHGPPCRKMRLRAARGRRHATADWSRKCRTRPLARSNDESGACP
jgi:hypothetical protein